MNKDRQVFLTELFNRLTGFLANSIAPRTESDIPTDKFLWIISQEEERAILTILATLEDCGADTDVLAMNRQLPKELK